MFDKQIVLALYYFYLEENVFVFFNISVKDESIPLCLFPVVGFISLVEIKRRLCFYGNDSRNAKLNMDTINAAFVLLSFAWIVF